MALRAKRSSHVQRTAGGQQQVECPGWPFTAASITVKTVPPLPVPPLQTEPLLLAFIAFTLFAVRATSGQGFVVQVPRIVHSECPHSAQAALVPLLAHPVPCFSGRLQR